MVDMQPISHPFLTNSFIQRLGCDFVSFGDGTSVTNKHQTSEVEPPETGPNKSE